MYALNGTSREHDLSTDIQKEMYSSVLVPVMTYTSEIWGNDAIRERIITDKVLQGWSISTQTYKQRHCLW